MNPEFIEKINEWGHRQIPFLFVIDFEMEKPFACRLEEAASMGILFDVMGKTNAPDESTRSAAVMTTIPFSREEYGKRFDKVAKHLFYGDSFLTNLTIKTEVKTSLSIRELFFRAKAKYKLLFKDEFIVFSPETFVRIANQRIFTYPMKGTIDASLPGAREAILRSPKEIAEHVTIVDLMRNDLSLVAKGVSVSRFRYIDELKTNHKNLLQVSSEIVGYLDAGFRSQLGTIIARLLPAGSVSGAPKEKTVLIIRDVEQEKRGYYAGVFGYFDGSSLETAVMIRFIEKQGDRYFYRSGGGITTQSVVGEEYEEAIDKIYVPID